MWPYWVMFFIPAAFALANSSARTAASQVVPDQKSRALWFITLIVLALLIGFRNSVGGDWGNYLNNYYFAQGETFFEALTSRDPGFELCQWLSFNLDWGIYGANLICGFLFATGLVTFCQNLPRPWLSLTVAIPYMMIVVAMGYTRQGAALGLVMLGFVALGRGDVRRFVFWTILGATFHKSAVILLPIAALASTRRRFLTFVWVGITTITAYILLLQDSTQDLYVNYIQSEYQSQGAMIRLLMNAIPALIMIVWRKKFGLDQAQTRLWMWITVISLILLFLLFVSSSSTAIDRIALYVIPLQIYVFSFVPGMFDKKYIDERSITLLIILYYALIEFVWLNYADNATYWVPYHFYLLQGLF